MPIELTPTEFRLLHYLMINAGQVVSKSQIRDRVWDYSFDGKVNMVEVYVSYLRKKLDAHGPPDRSGRSAGIGYCLRARSGSPTEPTPSGPDDGRRMTLRLRLLLLLVGIVAAGLLISDVVTYNALRSFLTTRVDQQLEVAAFPVGRALCPRRGSAPRCPRRPRRWRPIRRGPGRDGIGYPCRAPRLRRLSRGSVPRRRRLVAGRAPCATGVLVPPGTYGSSAAPRARSRPTSSSATGARPHAPRSPGARCPGSGRPRGQTSTSRRPAAVRTPSPTGRWPSRCADGERAIVVAVPLTDLDSTLGQLLLIELVVSPLVLVGLGFALVGDGAP